MQQEFWHNAWEAGKKGWQQKKVNSRLQRFWPSLKLSANTAVLVPLCGDSIDVIWLSQQGFQVVGSELSTIAVEDLFKRNQIEFDTEEHVGMCVYRSLDPEIKLTVYCGDFFALDATIHSLPPLLAAYDRAALVAMPAEMRPAYIDKLASLLDTGAKSLTITFAYDQAKMKGPPFSVPDTEMTELFDQSFDLKKISTSSGPDILGNLKERGLDSMEESVFVATRR